MKKIAFLAGLLLLLSPVLATAIDEAPAPELDSAEAQNTGGTSAKEAGDSVVLIFDEATNKPTINASNIDDVLDLNHSHSWLDGADAIGSATWSSDGKTLTITLSAGTSLPTVDVGDEVTISGTAIKDSDETENATGSEEIDGTFGTEVDNNNDNDQNNEGDEVDDNDQDQTEDSDVEDDVDSDEGEGQPCDNTLVNGELYKLEGEENTTVYLAAHCILKPFRGEAVFHARGGKFEDIIELDSLSGFTISDHPALPAAGTLIQGSDSTVWFVEHNGRRRGFTSADVFLGLGFHFGQIKHISDDDLNTIEEDNESIHDTSSHPDGTLLKCGNSTTVFVIIGGTEFPFTNLDAFELRGHSADHIAIVDCGRFHYVLGLAVT